MIELVRKSFSFSRKAFYDQEVLEQLGFILNDGCTGDCNVLIPENWSWTFKSPVYTFFDGEGKPRVAYNTLANCVQIL